MIRSTVNPELIRWARGCVNLSVEELSKQFKQLPEWESGEVQPTLEELEAFARATRVPFGYLFLPSPPDSVVLTPDIRDSLLAEILDTILDTLEMMRDQLKAMQGNFEAVKSERTV